VFVAGTVNVAVVALRVRIPIDSQGNLAGSNDPHGGAGWFVTAQGPITLLFGLFCVAAVAYQLLSFRTSSGERRQQLKWLGAGSASAVVVLLVTIFWPSAPAFVGSVLLPLALAGLPLSIGVGIVRYRLYEIDRLISRTLSYAILTALLAGTFIGLIALTTNTLALSGRVGVAASTLAAAALFNPLRIRIQRTVDRRFNRARYDAEATVAASPPASATPSSSTPSAATSSTPSTTPSNPPTPRCGSGHRADAVSTSPAQRSPRPPQSPTTAGRPGIEPGLPC
jgi:hypothetical protein